MAYIVQFTFKDCAIATTVAGANPTVLEGPGYQVGQRLYL